MVMTFKLIPEHEIYSKASMCTPTDEAAPSRPDELAPSRPDQPGSHAAPVSQADGPLASIKVPCFGDKLTRVHLKMEKV